MQTAEGFAITLVQCPEKHIKSLETEKIFTAGMLCSLPTKHMQHFSNKPGTAIGVLEELKTLQASTVSQEL